MILTLSRSILSFGTYSICNRPHFWLENPLLIRHHSPDGTKKAFARLTPDVDALDIAATKLAIV
jgi:hypothetical protein